MNKIPMSAYLLRQLNYPEESREDPLFCRYMDHFHIDKTWVLVTEYEEHEWIDLFDYIRQRKTPVSEREGMLIFSGIAQALCRLHSAGFTHSDVKENNVLVHRESLEIKLIDLCACREIPKGPISPTEYAGTMAYATPEVKTGNYFSPESQDIYALGILMTLVFLGGKLPSSINLEKDELDSHWLSKWIKEREELDISSVTVKFLQSMLSRKETKRPGILEVLDFTQSALEWA
jgi:protein-serine/threonine kinase